MSTTGSFDCGFGGDICELVNRIELQKIIECPICKTVPIPPIYNCTRGHIICFECRPKFKKCELCKSWYSEGRNFPLEAIISNSILFCKYKEEGCNVVIRGDLLLDHLKECDFRPAACLYCTERTEIPIWDFINHLIEKHKAISEVKDNEGYKLAGLSNREDFGTGSNIVFFQYNGKFFFSNITKSYSCLTTSVAIVGTDEEAFQYEVDVTFYNKNYSVPQIRWKLPVISFRQKTVSAMASLSIQWSQLKPLMIQNVVDADGKKYKYRWSYKYVIIQK